MCRYLPSSAVNRPVGLGVYTKAMMNNRILTIYAAIAAGMVGTSLAHAQQGYPAQGQVYQGQVYQGQAPGQYVPGGYATDERRRHLVLPGAHEDWLGLERRLATAVGARHLRELVIQQRDALAVDRDVHVLEPRVLTRLEDQLKLVLRVGRKHMVDDNAAARAIRRAFDVIPGVLRQVAGTRIGRCSA